jgi:16S rRNA processing protein RimM
MERPALLEVGRIDRAHGLKGEVVIRLTSDRVERVAPGSRLTTDVGVFEVVASRPQKDRYVVRLAGVDSKDAADALAGQLLRAEPIEDPDVWWADELIGCVVVDDTDGTERGTVESLQSNPASDLLVLDTGALVPLRFVVGDPADGLPDGRIHIDPPPGLFDL